MPCLKILTNLAKRDIPKDFVDKIIPVLSRTVGKPEQWLAQRRKLVEVTSNMITGGKLLNKIFINEDLTKTARALLWNTKKQLHGFYSREWRGVGGVLVYSGTRLAALVGYTTERRYQTCEPLSPFPYYSTIMNFICVVAPECPISFGGDQTKPGAAATLESIGHIDAERNKVVAKEITEFITKEMGIQPERFFLTFYDVTSHNVAISGTTVE